MASAARPAIPAEPLISRLRQKLRAAEAATGLGECALPLALGIPAIDAALGGGLIGGALHEIAAVREAQTAAATGFALALAACIARQQQWKQPTCAPHADLPLKGGGRPPELAQQAQAGGSLRDDAHDLRPPPRPSPFQGEGAHRARGHAVLWIAEDLALAEHGAPYGPGLDQTGLAPERLITIAVARGRDVLWAMEEALRCRAVGLVIGELRARGIDQVATRRLSLAAAAGNTLGLLLRLTPDDAPCPAVTRWIVAAAPSAPSPHGIGPPRLAARLVRNRRGHLGTWIVEWDSVEQRFVLAAHSELVARAAFDRPHQAAVA